MAKRNVSNAASALSMTRHAIGDVARPSQRTASDSIANLVAGLGTGRDKSSYSSYAFPRLLTRFELENMFRSSWLAKRIVCAPADDMTGEWRDFKFEDNDDNPHVDILKKAEKLLRVQHTFNKALRWGRLYGGAILILGIKNTPDLMVPLDVTTIKKGDLQYIHVIDRWRCSAEGTVKDLSSPMFGMPDSYLIAESAVRVHHTRVIRFEGEELPYFSWMQNARWDDSVLQHVYDALMATDQTTQSLATMMFEANVDVITREGLSDDLTTTEGVDRTDSLVKRYQLAALMKSMNRMLLLDGTEKYEKKTNSFANLDGVLDKFFDCACGAADIPRTRLFGQSPGGLNSTGDGDLRNYFGRITGDQKNKLGPKLEYFDEVFVRSAIGTMPSDYESVFNSLWETSDSEQALIDYQNAQRDAIYLTNQVLTEGAVAQDLKARGTYPSMSQEDVDMATELAKEPDPPTQIAMPNQTGQQQPTTGDPLNTNIAGTPGVKTPAKKTPSKKATQVK